MLLNGRLVAKPFVTLAAIVVTENYIVMLIYGEHSGSRPLCWLLSSTECKCVCNAQPRPSTLSLSLSMYLSTSIYLFLSLYLPSGCRFCLIIIRGRISRGNDPRRRVDYSPRLASVRAFLDVATNFHRASRVIFATRTRLRIHPHLPLSENIFILQR